MKTRIIRINADRPEKRNVERAAAAIRNGGIVVFPTETVYGIGANALDAKACRRIFSVKGRQRDNPLIVHVSSMKMTEEIGVIPSRYREILKRIWPAPLTVIVKSKDKVPKVVTAGLDTVAIRMPDNRVALEMIRRAGVPVAAPSANPSKMPSSTAFRHALKYFDGRVDIIINSEQSKFGLESTVLDLRNFTILRPGVFTTHDIEVAFGRKARVNAVTRGADGAAAATSPGMKYRHYAPRTPLFLYTGSRRKLARVMGSSKSRYAFIGTGDLCRSLPISKKNGMILGEKSDMKGIAARLFDALIRLDSLNVDFAVAESFEDEGIGLAIMNRLRKASNHSYFSDAKGLLILLKRYGIDINEDNQV
ncbi:MAG: threonylcarbamoyl-AMP synthase [Candidatus Micrarchaeota archaeon]|nr:threonylcarbamoyl-AMP synthase [Candidatus Micrarchaeota archaeon]